MLFNNLLVFARSRDRESRQIVELRLELESVWVDDLRDLDPLGGAYTCVYKISATDIVIFWYWQTKYLC